MKKNGIQLGNIRIYQLEATSLFKTCIRNIIQRLHLVQTIAQVVE